MADEEFFGSSEEEAKKLAGEMSQEEGLNIQRAVNDSFRGMGSGLYDTPRLLERLRNNEIDPREFTRKDIMLEGIQKSIDNARNIKDIKETQEEIKKKLSNIGSDNIDRYATIEGVLNTLLLASVINPSDFGSVSGTSVSPSVLSDRDFDENNIDINNIGGNFSVRDFLEMRPYSESDSEIDDMTELHNRFESQETFGSIFADPRYRAPTGFSYSPSDTIRSHRSFNSSRSSINSNPPNSPSNSGGSSFGGGSFGSGRSSIPDPAVIANQTLMNINKNIAMLQKDPNFRNRVITRESGYQSIFGTKGVNNQVNLVQQGYALNEQDQNEFNVIF
jgi:hypothetical protein